MIELSGHLPQPPTLQAKTWEKIKALHWNNVHTDRLRRETGDPAVCVAFCPVRKVWLLASLVNVGVRKGVGPLRASLDYERVPRVWGIWEDANKRPLSIDDPRLSQYVRSCNFRKGDRDALFLDMDREDALRAARFRGAIDDRCSDNDVRRACAKLADEVGAVDHRKGGEDGGPVRSTALFRRGAGAPQ